MPKKTLKIYFFILFFVLAGFYVKTSFSAVTGKLRGVVRDAKTGEPLPGVNVITSKVWENGVEKAGPQIGAATDIHGEFIILKIPPGTYTVMASMIGYNSELQQKVRINVDRTTRLNFSLARTVLDMGQEVVVTAKRDLVRGDVSATENYISEDQYENTPFANRVEDVIGLQSGVSGNLIEGVISIRAGGTRETGLLVDGMDMVNQKFNRPVISIQPGVVEEIKIVRNGFTAEYGQSRSGMINIITKDPSNRLHFSVDYQFTPAHFPHYGRNKYDPNWNLWRLYAGPKAFEGDTLITPDGLHEKIRTWIGWDKYAENLLSDNNSDNDLTAEEAYELWKWRHRPLKYGDKKGHNLDLSLSGKVPFLPWTANFLLGGKYEYHPFDYPQARNHFDEKSSTLKWVNIINPNIKLILNGLYSDTRSVSTRNPTSQWNRQENLSYNGGGFPNYYPFARPVINRYTSLVGAKYIHTLSAKMYYEINLNHFYSQWDMGRPDSARARDGRYFHNRLYLDPQSGWIPKEKGADDAASGYQMYGGGLTWENSWNRRTVLSASMTDQFHSAHELKLGFDVHYDIIRENRIHWHNVDSTQAYIRKYKVHPVEAGAYIQDKIEFQGMVANIGVRFDYFNVNSERPDPKRALGFASNQEIWETFTSGKYPTYRPRPQYYFSPRIGISHPLSEKSKIYFNYGHFVQTPPTFQLYTTNVDDATPSMLQMGNPDIPFEKTIAYELGCDFNVSDAFQLHLGAFYKDNFDIASSMTYAHIDQSLVMDSYAGNDYSEIRGIEVEVRKTVGRFIRGWLNYNYIKENESNLSVPGLSENPIVTDDSDVGVNGIVWGVPRSDVRLFHPYARGVVTLMAPLEWGPRLKGYSVLGGTNASFQLFYQSGPQRRHPSKTFRDNHPDVWFKELDRYWANVRFSRLFHIKSFRFEFYMDISNLFHTKFRYPPGGLSGEDYYYDLWQSGRLDQVGTDKLTNPKILRTENDDVYWAKVRTYIFGLRLNL